MERVFCSQVGPSKGRMDGKMILGDPSQRRQADKKAAELTEKQNSPHFVQPVKEVIEEA